MSIGCLSICLNFRLVFLNKIGRVVRYIFLRLQRLVVRLAIVLDKLPNGKVKHFVYFPFLNFDAGTLDFGFYIAETFDASGLF